MKTVLTITLFTITLFFISLSFCNSQSNKILTRNTALGNARVQDTRSQFILLNPGFFVPDGNYYSALIDPNWSGIDTVFSPLPGHVFQRSNETLTPIPIRGTVFGSVDTVVVKAISYESQVLYEKKVYVNPVNNEFSTTWSLPAGDYAWSFKPKNGVNPKEITIERAGIGEVFVAWGHSYMQGPGIGQDATDPRSRTVKNSFIESFDDPNGLFRNVSALPIIFEKITATNLGPFQSSSWIFGALADSLVKKLQMPVLIYSAAFGGSNIYQNRQNIVNEPFGYTWFGGGVLQENGFPFKVMSVTFQRYIPITGVRAIWIHHGLNDHGTVSNGGNVFNFKSNFKTVINQIRNMEAGGFPVALFLTKEDVQYTDINQQIEALIQDETAIYRGLDLTNPEMVGPWRDNNPGGTGRGHFIGIAGLQQYLKGWHAALHPLNWTDYPPLLWKK